jgi:hypothetical protein
VQNLWFSWQWLWRMSSSGVCCHVFHVRTDILEEHIASILRVVVFTLKMESIHSSEMSIPIRTTRWHIPEDDILQNKNNCRVWVLPYRTKLRPSLFYIQEKHLAKHDLDAVLCPVFWGQSSKLYGQTDSYHSHRILCLKHGSVSTQQEDVV